MRGRTAGPGRGGPAPGTDQVGGSVVASAMVRFVAIAVVALVVVGLASVGVARSVSRTVAVRDAVARGSGFARGVGAPLVDQGVWQGEPHSMALLNRVLDARLRDGSIKHIKVWDRSGRVLWSDEKVLVGHRFELESAVARLFTSGGAVGTFSLPDRPENVAERGEGALLEVYAAAPSASGQPVVIESYWPSEHIQDDTTQIMMRIAPLTLGALLVFALLVLPLAWTLARRVERTRNQNNALLRRALSASQVERARIARDLHDGVMQDVSGAGYALSAVASSLGTPPVQHEQVRARVEEVAVLLGRVGESLRSTLVDIYPPNLATDGLAAAVDVLVDRARRAGTSVVADVRALEGEPLDVLQLCYRLVQEGLRNVEQHAEAENAVVVGSRTGEEVRLVVEDDGRGLGNGGPPEGHVGLRLLRDMVQDVGGTLELRESAAGGTALLATFPRQLDARG